jgi:outer membrane protein
MQAKKLAVAIATLAICALAHAGEVEKNAIRIGYAKVRFDLQSGDLTGPPGTTPPGLKLASNGLHVYAISYERRLSENWAAQFQGGIPPTLTAVGAGLAAPVGAVARARIWFPTAMLRFSPGAFSGFRPYVAGGVTYTFFTEQESSPAYTAALQGASSTIDIKPAWGAYARAGFEYALDRKWCLNVEYSSFRLKTSAAA